LHRIVGSRAGEVFGDQGQDIAQIGRRVEPVERALDQGVDGGGARAACIGTCEEEVVAAQGQRVDGALGRVIEYLPPTILDVSCERRPP
jgi:hypothetical protein